MHVLQGLLSIISRSCGYIRLGSILVCYFKILLIRLDIFPTNHTASLLSLKQIKFNNYIRTNFPLEMFYNQLRKVVREVWNSIYENELHDLILSMEDRCWEFTCADGMYIVLIRYYSIPLCMSRYLKQRKFNSLL